MTTHTDIEAICDAAVALALGVQFDTALRLLDGTTPDPADAPGRLRLALTAADVADRAQMAAGAEPADARLAELDKLLTDLDADPAARWDADWLHLRHAYSSAIRNPDGSFRMGPDAHDPADVARLVAEAERVRGAAPDDVRRGWASMCLGWISDNVVGDRDAAPAHYRPALEAGRAGGDDVLVFEGQRHLGDHAHDDGDLADARERWRESAAAGARAGHVGGTLAQVLLLAVLLRDEGDEAGAQAVGGEVARWAAAADVRNIARQAEAFVAGVDPTRAPDDREDAG